MVMALGGLGMLFLGLLPLTSWSEEACSIHPTLWMRDSNPREVNQLARGCTEQGSKSQAL